MARAVGFLLGPISKITVFSNFSNMHKGLFINLLILGISIYTMTITYNVVLLMVASFFMAISTSLLDIFINMSIVVQTNHQVGRSIIISHGFLMIGAFASSFALGLWGSESIRVFGIIAFLFSFAFLRL